MSHFGRSGPPDIKDTFSLLVLNISFRTSPDDLYPLFDKYGKVVDVFIPRDRRTGDSRGFAFVRYKYADEAQKAVDKLDGITVDGRDIMVQFAKYGPNAEPVKKGRVTEVFPRSRGRSRSRSPRPRYQDDHRGKDYRRRNYSPSHGRYECRTHRDSEREYRRRSTPDYNRGRGKAVCDSDRNRYKSRSDESMSPQRRNPSPKRSRSPDSSPHGRSPHRRSRDGQSPRNDGRGKAMHDNGRKRYRSCSLESGSPAKRSPTPKRSQSPDSPNRRSPHRRSLDEHSPQNRSRDEHSPQNRSHDRSLYDNDQKRHKSRSCECSASPVRRNPTPKRSISLDCPNKRSPNRRSRDCVRLPRSPLESASHPRCSTPLKKSLSPDGTSSPSHGRRSSRRSHSASPIDRRMNSPQSS